MPRPNPVLPARVSTWVNRTDHRTTACCNRVPGLLCIQKITPQRRNGYRVGVPLLMANDRGCGGGTLQRDRGRWYPRPGGINTKRKVDAN